MPVSYIHQKNHGRAKQVSDPRWPFCELVSILALISRDVHNLCGFV